MAAAAETTSINLVVTGADKAAAQTDKVAASFKKLEMGGGDASKTLGQAGERFAKVSSVLGSLDTGASKLVGTLGRAAGATQAFTAALGGGPAGIIAGGLIGAFALWSDYTDTQERKLIKLTKATDEARFASLKFDQQLQRVTGERSKAETKSRLASGFGSSAEYEAEIARLESINQRLAAGQASGALNPEYRVKKQYENEARLQQLQEQLQQARDREAIQAALANGGNATGAIGENIADRKATKATSDQSAARNQLEALRASENERKEIYASTSQYLRGLQAEDNARFKSDLKLNNEFESEARQRQADRNLEIKRNELAELERLDAEAQAKGDARRAAVTAGLQNVAGASVSALQKVAKGQKQTVAAFLEGIGDQTVASGTSHILQGIALSVINPAQGVPLIAAGGAEVAFGIGLGAAAGGGSKGGGAHAAGGGSYRSSEPVGLRPANDNGEPQVARANLTINVNANVVDEHAGVLIVRSIEEAHRKMGTKLPRTIV